MKIVRNLYLLILGVFAAFAVAANANAVEQPLSPKMDDVKPRVIEGTGVQNPNLLADLPALGSRAHDAAPRVIASTGIQDPDLLAVVKNCTMAPRTKDTPACKKMCEATGKVAVTK